MEHEWMETKQIADYCKVSIKTVYRWIDAGGFPHARPNGVGKILSKASWLDEWLTKQARNVPGLGESNGRIAIQEVRGARRM